MIYLMNRSKSVKRMIKIVHCKKETYQVYCGRPSIYGNNYVIGKDGDRAQVIAKYKKDFDKRIIEDK